MDDTTTSEPITNTFRAIDHLIAGLPVIPFERVRTQWANCKINKARFPADELLAALEWASRGERTLIETALTLYNGGEYLVRRPWPGTDANTLRHVMDWTDTAVFARIMRALLIARGLDAITTRPAETNR